MNRFIEYLHLKDVGFLELLFALYPILSGYSISGLPMYLLMLLVMDVFAIQRERVYDKSLMNPILLFTAFYVFHDMFLGLMNGFPVGAFNMLIGVVIVLASLLIIAPTMKLEKVIGSLYWVAILSIFGMIFHFGQFYTGRPVTPLTLPILEDLSDKTRLFEEVIRPRSFFPEPQSYVSFMMLPLIVALNERKFIWAGLIIFTVLLSTSTTGIVFVFLILGGFIFSQRIKLTYQLVIIFAVVLFAYLLNTSDFFVYAMDKMNNTTMESDLRLYQGRSLVMNMNPLYWIIGMPYLNAYEYYLSGETLGLDIVIYGDHDIFIPTLWNMILRFGLVGLALYLFIYYKLFINARHLWPWAICLIAGLFSNPDSVGGTFMFCMSFAYLYGNVYYNAEDEDSEENAEPEIADDDE